MDCKKINPLILKYIEGEISAQDEEILRKHTESCPHCRAELMLYRSIKKEECLNCKIPESFDLSVMGMIDKGFNPNTLRLKLFYASYAAVSVMIGVFLMLSESKSLTQICTRYNVCGKYAKYAQNIEGTFFGIRQSVQESFEILTDYLNVIFDGFEFAAFITLISVFAVTLGYTAYKSK